MKMKNQVKMVSSKVRQDDLSLLETKSFDIGISTQYTEIIDQSGKKNKHLLTLQIYIKQHNKRIIVFNTETSVQYQTKATIFEKLGEQYIANNVCDLYFYKKFCDDTPVLHEVICDYCKMLNLKFPKKIVIILYYALIDLFFCFGFNNCRSGLLSGRTYLKNRNYIDRNISLSALLKFSTNPESNTNIIEYSVFDISGLTSNKSKLDDFAESCGLELNPRKRLLSVYFNNISLAMFHNEISIRVLFGQSAMDEAVTTLKIKSVLTENINDILKGCLKFNDRFLFKSSNTRSNLEIPSTMGTLVSVCFQNHVYNSVLESGIFDIKTFKWACTKHGHLEEFNTKSSRLAKEEHKKLINEIDYYKIVSESHFSNYNYTVDSFNMASIPYFLESSKFNKLYTLATVTGGRCNNERYRETFVNNVLDMDFSSCYGSALESLSYPIGKPSTYSTDVNNKQMSLSNFLCQYENQFVPGTWKIIVNGPLDFSQDLIYSKVESTNIYASLKKKLRSPSYHTADNVNPMKEHVLLRKSIINGVITGPELELIRKISSSQEYKSWMALQVTSAAWYPKQCKIDNVAEWTKLSISTASPQFDKWTFIELATFISPLLQKRKAFKAILQDIKNQQNVKDESAKKLRYYSSQEKQIKLIINTLYGTIASSFFRIGNCIVADNITSRPRVDIWKALKVLNGAQSITDGFAYQPSNINAFRNNKTIKPGFNSLSDYYNLIQHRALKKVSLESKDWDYIYSSGGIKNIDYKQLDQTVTKEINSFWERYTVTPLSFPIEHKPEKTAFRMGYWGKGTYMLHTIDNKIIVKARGHDINDIDMSQLESMLEAHDYSENSSLLEDSNDSGEGLVNRDTFDQFKSKIEKNVFENNPMFEWLFNLTFENQKLPSQLKYSKTRMLSIKEWRMLYTKDTNIEIRPDDIFTNHDFNFQIKATHFPNFELKDYKKKMNEMQSKKAIPYLEKYRDLSPTQILQNMLEKHKVFSSAKNLTKKKVTKKKVTKTKNSVFSKK